jgi:hypothetical protein
MQRLEISKFDRGQEIKQLELDIKELEKYLAKLVKKEKRQRQQVGIVCLRMYTCACMCSHA